MFVALMTFISSFSLLAVCIVLFRIEENRGQRLVLGPARGWLDQKVLGLNYLLSHLSVGLGSGAVRITFHFLMHKVLRTTLSALKSLEYKVTHLQRQNRNVVKNFNTSKERTHLHLIAEHQVHTALSDDQKQERKDKAMGAN